MGDNVARTSAFSDMIVSEKIGVFEFRSQDQSRNRMGWFFNLLLIGAVGGMLLVQVAAVYRELVQKPLHTAQFVAEHWVTIGSLALLLIIAPEQVNFVLPKLTASNGARKIHIN